MAAPGDMTSIDLSGKYMMVCSAPCHAYARGLSLQLIAAAAQNKSLSDDTDDILRLQGVGWWTRKAISMATIYLDVKHYKDDNGVEHIDIDQTLSGGISGTSEYRILDWDEREHEDHVFGPVLSKSRRVKLSDIERDWLKKDWLDESLEDGYIINTAAKSNTAKSGKSWSSEQVRAAFCRFAMEGLPARPRFGALSKSMALNGTLGTSTSRGRKERSFKFVWCTTTVSPYRVVVRSCDPDVFSQRALTNLCS